MQIPICVGTVTYLKVRVIESIEDIPTQHLEFTPLNQHRMEEAKREQQLLVLVLFGTAAELLFCHQVIQTLHVGF